MPAGRVHRSDALRLSVVPRVAGLATLAVAGSLLWEMVVPLPVYGAARPYRFMELGKDPGLGVRSLHAQGATGKGVHVAFIDQALLVDHQEYREQIVRYVELGLVDNRAVMHGAAVASILAGKTVGVAPEARVTYYAAQLGQRYFYGLQMQRDFARLFLPRAKLFWATGTLSDSLTMVTMDSRTTAAETGVDQYRFYRQGGEPWSVPYVVGLYALVAQVCPQVTPEESLEAAHATGAYTHEGQSYRFGPIVNPAALVEHFTSSR